MRPAGGASILEFSMRPSRLRGRREAGRDRQPQRRSALRTRSAGRPLGIRRSAAPGDVRRDWADAECSCKARPRQEGARVRGHRERRTARQTCGQKGVPDHRRCCRRMGRRRLPNGGAVRPIVLPHFLECRHCGALVARDHLVHTRGACPGCVSVRGWKMPNRIVPPPHPSLSSRPAWRWCRACDSGELDSDPAPTCPACAKPMPLLDP